MMKAFDRVDRDCLLAKLLAIGVRGKFYNIVKHLYSNSQARINVNGHYTRYFNVECSVEQGNIISPTFFSIHINDLATELKLLDVGVPIDDEKLCILLYADDIVLLSESENDLQTILNAVHKWCQSWRMKINVSKTNVVHFRKQSQPLTTHKFTIGNDEVKTTSQYKYLGCMLSDTLDFNATANTLAESAGRALGSVLNKARSTNGLTFKSYEHLYKSCVLPVMEYSAGVWGYKTYQKCETIQNRAIRAFLGVHKHASNVAIQGDVGWFPTKLGRHLAMVRLWNRLINMPSDKTDKTCFLVGL